MRGICKLPTWQGLASVLLFGFVPALLLGCTSNSRVRIEKGLSMEAFENLGPLDRQNATLGVIIPQEVRQSVIEQQKGQVKYQLDVGNALSSKLMQILAYKFERVVFRPDEKSEPAIPCNLTMRVELTESNLELHTKSGWSTYTMMSGGYIGIRATIVNQKGEVVWAGFAKAEGHGESAAGAYQVPDIQGGMSEAIDIAVAQIANQLGKSEALRNAIREVGASGSR